MSPDIDSLIGMLKPFVFGKKWRSDTRDTISFIKGSSCQMHSTVQSIPLSQFWHLPHLLKVFIVLRSIDLIVVSKETAIEVVTDICHITKVVINTVGDPRIRKQVQRSDLCGTVSTNLMTQLSLTTIRSVRHYYDHSGTIPGAIHCKPLDDIFSVHGPCGGFETMCLTENGIPVDLEGVCC